MLRKNFLKIFLYKLSIIVLFSSFMATITTPDKQEENLIIQEIEISGNDLVPLETVLSRIPYKVGKTFNPSLSGNTIRLLSSMGYFKPNIKILGKKTGEDKIKLKIIVEEKNRLKEISFEGNKKVSSKEIEKETGCSNIIAFDQSNIEFIRNKILELYSRKDFHDVKIEIEVTPTSENLINAKFIIEEGIKSTVKRIIFKGNKTFTSKKLRSILISREDWLLGFMNRAGSYQPEAIEVDRNIIEDFYRSNGFIHATVTNISLDETPKDSRNYTITFEINEGKIYTIKNVNIEGSDLIPKEIILEKIGIFCGDLFSTKKVRQAMEILKLLWGEFGFIFSNVDVIPEVNEREKQVDLTFITDLGEKTICRQINIIGNNRTRDKVIRREIQICEGNIITTQAMENSKLNVERLGYFDPNYGANWKIDRLEENKADLNMIVKEIRTGRIYSSFRYGGDAGDFQNPSRSLEVELGIKQRNLFGSGIIAEALAKISRRNIDLNLSLTEPWLMDRPIRSGIIFEKTSSLYEDFTLSNDYPNERRIAGSGFIGVYKNCLGGTSFLFDLGFENLKINNISIGPQNTREVEDKECVKNLNNVLKKTFRSGNILWMGGKISQDLRNNPVIPTRGYSWLSSIKLGIPYEKNGFGFIKWDFDFNWYYPLVNEFDLIFKLYGHCGITQEIGRGSIPYRELYHIGGPSSVRGFLFGEIGPTLFRHNSIGGKKAFWINAEVVLPIRPDFSLAAIAFYDGGASWDTPLKDEIKCGLRNNQFNYRHSVGLGFKMTSPVPVSIAIGLKLNRNKKLGESLTELHFTQSIDF